METKSIVSGIEAALADQLALAGGDPVVVAAGEALVAALRPALRRAMMDVAEQAALEIDAQLPDHQVEVVLRDGDPTMVVRTETSAVSFTTEDLDARLTLRLPPQLKSELEQAARSVGDSINGYVIRSLVGKASTGKAGRRVSGTFET
ncbi:MAG: hypothetical protein H0V96_08760 [Acidimicrobiia bacterium]|nr:hypothetical protein [Acidimicrobiia bacterium]